MSAVLVLSCEIFHVSGSGQTCCRQYREVKKSGQSALGFRHSARTKSLICPVFPFVKKQAAKPRSCVAPKLGINDRTRAATALFIHPNPQSS